jgi:hypothetical protein
MTIVPMHVPFRIHYRNNLIDKKDSCPIPRRVAVIAVTVISFTPVHDILTENQGKYMVVERLNFRQNSQMC